MPCRALEAFRLILVVGVDGDGRAWGLNALSGIGGVQTDYIRPVLEHPFPYSVLMPCRALEAFRLIFSE